MLSLTGSLALNPISPMSQALDEIVAGAPQTRVLELRPGALDELPRIFQRHFASAKPLIVADPTTYRVAGQTALELLLAAGHPEAARFVFEDPAFYAEQSYVTQLQLKLRQEPRLVPVAVGSGTISDVVKLAAHEAGRRYLAIATAASMDGYTAFGASITRHASKQTRPCAAPLAVIADLSIIAAAPAALSAAGYADLLAKMTAGADWILAAELGVEPIHQKAWDLAQSRLLEAVENPAQVRSGGLEAIQSLTEGLLLTGFAMQFAESSRPASGAEHQFSHLLDMRHHTVNGMSPLHGFKVGLGILAVAALYEYILKQPLDKLDISRCCDAWPEESRLESIIRRIFPDRQLAEVALVETRAKHNTVAELRDHLLLLRRQWPGLAQRLRRQLISFARFKQMLREAGAPVEPEEIGLTRRCLRESFVAAYHLRRRFTVLDLAVRTGLLDSALDQIFAPGGHFDQRAG